MPSVPRYNQRVKEEALPGARVTPAADAEAFGGGASLEKVGAGLRSVADTATKYVIAQQDAADDLATQDADLQASQLQTKLQVEALKRQGKNAAEAETYVNTEWQKGTAEISKNLANDRQRGLLQRKLAVRYGELNKSVQVHMANEFQKYDGDTTQAFLDNSREEAAANYGDPRRVARTLYVQQSTIQKYAERNGLSPEATKKMIAESRSDVHFSVIDRMLANKDAESARKYYDGHKTEIVGDKAKSIDGYIEASKNRIVSEAAAAQEAVYDQNYRRAMLSMFKGELPLSELQRQFRNNEIKEGDYNTLERKLVTPEYKLLQRTGKSFDVSDPEIFNEIREAQISGAMTPAQLDRYIVEKSELLTKEDAIFLSNVNKGLPPNPKDQHIQSQANSIREFGTRYLSKDGIFERGKKDKAIEALVADFHKRAEKETDMERIDALAQEVITAQVKRDNPELNRYEDIPHIVIDIQGRVQRLLKPDQKTKLKGRWKLVPAKTSEPEKKPAKE